MAAILPRTALLLRTPRGAGRLARFLGAGVPAASSSDAETAASAAAEFMPWRNGGGVLHRAASVDPSAVVEAGAVVHSGAVIGKEVVVGSGTVVGPSVSVGQSTRIGYNVVLSNCSVGEFCTIHNGACIGQDGFGFFVDQDGQVKKKPQELYARIGDNVEIGANTCIDRGSWRDTMIGDDTKIDNLVQIGHNVVIGKCCMICGQVGIAGSATLGDYVVLGGRVAIRDHVSIASKVRLAANSLATKDIQEPGDYGGFPAPKWSRYAHECSITCYSQTVQNRAAAMEETDSVSRRENGFSTSWRGVWTWCRCAAGPAPRPSCSGEQNSSPCLCPQATACS